MVTVSLCTPPHVADVCIIQHYASVSVSFVTNPTLTPAHLKHTPFITLFHFRISLSSAEPHSEILTQ